MENIKVFIRVKPSEDKERVFTIDSSTDLFNKKTKEYFSFSKRINNK